VEPELSGNKFAQYKSAEAYGVGAQLEFTAHPMSNTEYPFFNTRGTWAVTAG